MDDALNESEGKRLRILFVCTGNTCRSVLAEYIARHKFSNVVESESAGIRPQAAADAASAIATLNELGIDAIRHQPRGLEEVDPAKFDRVVAMEPFVARKFKEKFPSFPQEKFSKWNINDPWDDPAAYKGCAEKIYAQLKRFLELPSGKRS
jgi:protein-tyrosine-phosphatase